MQYNEQELRQQIVDVGKLVFEKGWVAAHDGNISVRLDDERILCTPTGVSKGMMKPDDMTVCDLEGRKISGRLGCSTELGMHLAVYRLRSDVGSVLHAHPPVATGFAAAGRGLNAAVLPEVIVNFGSIPLAAYGLPGTPELAEELLPFIPKYNAILMENHGAVAYGEDLWKAYFRMETVEHSARILFVAEMLGGPKALPRAQVQRLFESRSRYGVQSLAGFEPDQIKAAEDLNGNNRRYQFTREELLNLIDEALRARGVVT
jgi:L-fuculose-phosphate aldolase